MTETQENKILEVLRRAHGEWISGQYFLHELYFSQYHRAIWNLQHRRQRYDYEGEIEASTFTDEHGFKSYRLIPLPLATVPSRSEAGVERKIWEDRGKLKCSCPGFSFRGFCSHITGTTPATKTGFYRPDFLKRKVEMQQKLLR